MYEQKGCSLKGDLKSGLCQNNFDAAHVSLCHKLTFTECQQHVANKVRHTAFQLDCSGRHRKCEAQWRVVELCGEARTHRTSEPKVSVCNLKNAKNLQSKSVTFFSSCIGRFFSAAIKDHSWNLSRWTSACHLMSGKLKSESLWEGLKCFKVFHSKNSFYLNTRYLKRCFKGGIWNLRAFSGEIVFRAFIVKII